MEPRRWAGRTAVVVDDWALVRLGIVAALRPLEIRVVADAASGREGVRSAAAAQAQLVVLGSHGDQPIGDTVRRAKQLPQAPDVVVLLEQTDREELTMLLGAGVDALLVRCIGEAELGDALARLLAGERVVSPALLPILVGVMDLARRDGDQDGLLTSKEREVLARLAEGRSNQSIAAALSVTPATVKTHLAHIYGKLGAQNRHEALHRAVARGLLT